MASVKSNHITECYEYVGEWELWIGYQKVKVRVKKDKHGAFHYDVSHNYWGSKQAGPYLSSHSGPHKSVDGALFYAEQELFSFYDPNDQNAQWVENPDY